MIVVGGFRSKRGQSNVTPLYSRGIFRHDDDCVCFPDYYASAFILDFFCTALLVALCNYGLLLSRLLRLFK